MTREQITAQHNSILSHLQAKQLKQAIAAIRPLTEAAADWHLTDRLNALADNYALMLRYMESAIADPERESMYARLLAEAYAIADLAADRLLLLGDTSSQIYSKRRLFEKPGNRLSDAIADLEGAADRLALALTPAATDKIVRQLRARQEQALATLFDAIRTGFPLTADEAERLSTLFSSELIERDLRLTLCSALTLGMLTWHDELKLALLLRLADPQFEPEPTMRLRALTGLLLAALAHPDRMGVSPTATKGLQALLESPPTRRLVRRLQMLLVYTRESERIARKLKEEIIPDMIKASAGKKPFDQADIASLEENPEWERMLDRVELSDKVKESLREISELQLEGADVMLSAFSGLKHFPFFESAAAWFTPFSGLHTAIADILSDRNQLHTIERLPMFCDSDKYSLLFSIGQIPLNIRTTVLAEQMNAYEQALEQTDEPDADRRLEQTARLYIQDLYRFFRLYSRHDDYRNPFDGNLLLLHQPLLRPAFEEDDAVLLLAELFLKRSYWADAASLYGELVMASPEADLYQKLGYCLQHLGQTEEALAAYLQADLIRPDSPWTLRRMAQCYRNLSRPADALAAYRRFARLKPDNLAVELNMGHCLLELKDYEGALTHYFKVDYLDPESGRAWCPLAWCSLLTGRLDQANSYYDRILADSPTATDLLNAGHARRLKGDVEGAIALYRRAQSADEAGFNFAVAYLADKADLLRAGLSDTDFHLMLDFLTVGK